MITVESGGKNTFAFAALKQEARQKMNMKKRRITSSLITRYSLIKDISGRNFAIFFVFIGVILLFESCNGEPEQKLGNAQKPQPAITWEGANSGQSFTLGQDVKIAFTSGTNQLKSPVQVMVNDSLIGQCNVGERFEVMFNTSELMLGEHVIKLIATKNNGQNEVRNFIFELLSDVKPEMWTVKVLEKLPHNTASYTQGLEFYNGKLYEGTGLAGSSRLMEIDLATGKEKRGVALDAKYFGEGITILNDKVYQLTYQNRKALVWDVNSFELINEIRFPDEIKEGWGLTNNGSELILSDGTEKLYFIDPNTFKINKTLSVYNNLGAVNYLNELELIDGVIYANIYQYDIIAMIDIKNGKVLGQIYLDNLKNEFQVTTDTDVLNGIAKDPMKQGIYVTGKKWPHLFRVEIVPRKIES